MLTHISQTRTIKKYLNLKWKHPPSRVLPPRIPKPITGRQYRFIMLLGTRMGLSVRQLNDQCFSKYEADLRTMDRDRASQMIQGFLKYTHPGIEKKREIFPPR
jgi:hypothetical protein